jgi:hypothetical protein
MKQPFLKAYESPKAEVIEIESQGVLCASGGGSQTTPGGYNLSNEAFTIG